MNGIRLWHPFPWPGMLHVYWQVCQPCLTSFRNLITMRAQLRCIASALAGEMCHLAPLYLTELFRWLTWGQQQNTYLISISESAKEHTVSKNISSTGLLDLIYFSCFIMGSSSMALWLTMFCCPLWRFEHTFMVPSGWIHSCHVDIFIF